MGDSDHMRVKRSTHTISLTDTQQLDPVHATSLKDESKVLASFVKHVDERMNVEFENI